MDEGLQSAVNLLAVVVAIAAIVVNGVLAVFVYKLTQKDEMAKVAEVFKQDREARQEIFEHERSLQREERRAAAFKEFGQALEILRAAAQTPIWDAASRDAFSAAVDDFFYSLGPLDAISDASEAVYHFSKALLAAGGWVGDERSTNWQELNVRRTEILSAAITARTTIQQEWFHAYAGRLERKSKEPDSA
jgi:hypothetical protein